MSDWDIVQIRTICNTRRIWFLYEWLLGRELDLPAADKVAYADAVDTGLQCAGSGQNSARHRVRNNMPGTPEFCPLVFKTKAIDEFIGQDLKERARVVVSEVPKELLARTAAFLLLKDSKSSYVIEGERPSPGTAFSDWGVPSARQDGYDSMRKSCCDCSASSSGTSAW